MQVSTVDKLLMREGSRSATALSDAERVVLALLFKKYRFSLFRYLKKLVPDEDAAELVQECYVRLLRHSGVVQLEAVARAYLFRTATNLARDYFRRRLSHRADQHIDIDAVAEPVDSDSPERTLVWNEALASVKQAVLHLPATTRRVFILNRFRGKTYPEIAAILGVSSRTVERRMSEAMEELSSRIGDAL